jgi:MoxR-like ATPase
LTAKARALLKGRYSVLTEDIHAMAPAVLRHRILMNFKAEAEGITSDKVTAELIKVVERTKALV